MMRKRGFRFALLYLAAAAMIFIGARIEVLNARAGYRLPMDDVKRRSREAGGSGAWRAFWYDEQKWRDIHIREDRPLTPEEEAQMHRQIHASNANWDLRNSVTDWGWLQYVLVIGVFLCSYEWWREERPLTWRIRIVYLIPVIVGVAAGVLAVYRGYLRSTID